MKGLDFVILIAEFFNAFFATELLNLTTTFRETFLAATFTPVFIACFIVILAIATGHTTQVAIVTAVSIISIAVRQISNAFIIFVSFFLYQSLALSNTFSSSTLYQEPFEDIFPLTIEPSNISPPEKRILTSFGKLFPSQKAVIARVSLSMIQ